MLLHINDIGVAWALPTLLVEHTKVTGVVLFFFNYLQLSQFASHVQPSFHDIQEELSPLHYAQLQLCGSCPLHVMNTDTTGVVPLLFSFLLLP